MQDLVLPRLIFCIHLAQEIAGIDHAVFELCRRAGLNAFPEHNNLVIGPQQLPETIEFCILLPGHEVGIEKKSLFLKLNGIPVVPYQVTVFLHSIQP
ncbi:hypothetical protein D3C87_1750810 [compost metagenome]